MNEQNINTAGNLVDKDFIWIKQVGPETQIQITTLGEESLEGFLNPNNNTEMLARPIGPYAPKTVPYEHFSLFRGQELVPVNEETVALANGMCKDFMTSNNLQISNIVPQEFKSKELINTDNLLLNSLFETYPELFKNNYFFKEMGWGQEKSELIFFKRETSKGTEVGILPAYPNVNEEPVTLRFDEGTNSIKYLKSTLARNAELPTMSMRYHTLTEQEIEGLKTILQGKKAMAMNSGSLTISEEVGKVLQDQLGLTVLNAVHPNAINLTDSAEGLVVPENYSAKIVNTIYRELMGNTYDLHGLYINSRMSQRVSAMLEGGEVASLDSAMNKLNMQ